MRPPILLIIEDEERMRRLFELVLSPEGYGLRLARTGELGLQLLADTPAPDLIITDLQLGSGMTGMQVLESAKGSYPDIPVLIVTGYGTVKSAVEAMQKGAYDYISKPIDNDELTIVVARAIELRRLSQTHRAMCTDLENEYGFDRMISLSPRMAQLKALALDIAKTDATVLLTGESGTGKELLARAIHLAGARSGGPLVAVNCAAVSRELVRPYHKHGFVLVLFVALALATPGLGLRRGALWLGVGGAAAFLLCVAMLMSDVELWESAAVAEAGLQPTRGPYAIPFGVVQGLHRTAAAGLLPVILWVFLVSRRAAPPDRTPRATSAA